MLASRTTEMPSSLLLPRPVTTSTSPDFCIWCCRSQLSTRAAASLAVGSVARRFSVRVAPKRTSSNACASPANPPCTRRGPAMSARCGGDEGLRQHAAVHTLGRRHAGRARQRRRDVHHERALGVATHLEPGTVEDHGYVCVVVVR